MKRLFGVVAAGVVVLATAPAFADEPGAVTPHVVRAAARVQQAGAETVGDSDDAAAPIAQLAPVVPVERETNDAVPAPPQVGHKTSSCRLMSSCGYHRVLGYLVITRDVDVPGAPGVAIRLLPTSHALAGDSDRPIVVRPAVTGGGYGLDIAARF